jgi:hypothetical protein
MGDLLKEAIADAKAVRETALANAKMALEEAFTPQLKSMLSAKLREEDDEFEGEEEVPAEDEIGDEEDIEDVVDDEVADEEEVEEESIDTSDVDTDAISEEEDEEVEFEDEDDEEVEEELDLEAIIKELESELSEEEEYEDDEEDVEESVEEIDEDEEFEIDESLFEEGEDEEEVNEETDEEEVSEVASVQAELDEYKEAVHFLKDKLHEVNILNAKLLFTNKLFKEFTLDNGQKLKVVETFDRAQTTREIKLVYSTLAEQFGDNGSITRKNNIKESASKPVSSTKPSKESKKVITEETQVADRFRKLAGLL